MNENKIIRKIKEKKRNEKKRKEYTGQATRYKPRLL